MQKFEYRSPRFSVDLSAQLTLQNSTLIGRCKEISKEGMRLELRQPPPTNSVGTVSISHQGRTLQLKVRVAHAGATYGGLVFMYESEKERSSVAHFVASLAAPENPPGPVLVY